MILSSDLMSSKKLAWLAVFPFFMNIHITTRRNIAPTGIKNTHTEGPELNDWIIHTMAPKTSMALATPPITFFLFIS